jgi:citrate synthase
MSDDKHLELSNPETGDTHDVPLVEPVMGPPSVDARKAFAGEGVFNYDPGYVMTSSCDSAITFIDGEEGRLFYRGYSIQELAKKSSFIEVAYLLLHGELPGKDDLDEFKDSIRHHSMIDEGLRNAFKGFHYDAPPMSMLTGVVGSLASFYHENTDINDPADRALFARRMIAKIPTIAAAAYKHSIGQPFIYPRNDLGYADNLLHMLFAVPPETYEPSDVHTKALEMLLILHADHEQNASASTVRMAGSTGTNPYAAIAAGIAALWGPAHGGANLDVIRMLEEIGDASQIDQYVDKAKDKNDPFMLMGFGHRVYNNRDPRAAMIQEYFREVLEHTGKETDRLFDLALKMEEKALNDDYFKERNLFPNVDFYSGIIYRAMGIPENMFIPMFAIARTTGWVSHWCEMLADPNQKIHRPRQVYTGYGPRDYVPMERRD